MTVDAFIDILRWLAVIWSVVFIFLICDLAKYWLARSGERYEVQGKDCRAPSELPRPPVFPNRGQSVDVMAQLQTRHHWP